MVAGQASSRITSQLSRDVFVEFHRSLSFSFIRLIHGCMTSSYTRSTGLGNEPYCNSAAVRVYRSRGRVLKVVSRDTVTARRATSRPAPGQGAHSAAEAQGTRTLALYYNNVYRDFLNRQCSALRPVHPGFRGDGNVVACAALQRCTTVVERHA